MFKKSNTGLKESPLGYWEEKSYMLAIPENEEENPLIGLFDRVENIAGVEILEKREFEDGTDGYMRLSYKGEEFEVGFFPKGFYFEDYYILPTYFFKQEDVEKLRNAKIALTIYMKLSGDAKKAFHFQLKLIHAIMPNLLAVLDESAEKLFPADWVKMSIGTAIYPSANDLYTVQAVSGKNGEVWLHTHGLCRFGLTELEILESDVENYNHHYNLIATLASYLLDKKNEVHFPEKGVYIGLLNNGQPVVATCLSWTEGLKEYKKLKLGNVDDRKNGHNSRTSIIFIYQSEEEEEKQILSKVSVYNDLWGENPLFFLSNEETDRMKSLAIERFSYVEKALQNKESDIIVKIGLQTDENDEDHLEHIWFKLLDSKEGKLKCKLLQEPYHVENMHEGDEGWYRIGEVTDWIIYEESFQINPGNVYILEDKK